MFDTERATIAGTPLNSGEGKALSRTLRLGTATLRGTVGGYPSTILQAQSLGLIPKDVIAVVRTEALIQDGNRADDKPTLSDTVSSVKP